MVLALRCRDQFTGFRPAPRRCVARPRRRHPAEPPQPRQSPPSLGKEPQNRPSLRQFAPPPPLLASHRPSQAPPSAPPLPAPVSSGQRVRRLTLATGRPGLLRRLPVSQTCSASSRRCRSRPRPTTRYCGLEFDLDHLFIPPTCRSAPQTRIPQPHTRPHPACKPCSSS